MIAFDLHVEGAGWASLSIRTDERSVECQCSDLGGDSLGDLVGGFARLATGAAALVEVNCYSEPGDAVLTLRRSGDDLELVVKRYAWEGDGAPSRAVDKAMRKQRAKDWGRMRRARNRKATLRCRGSFDAALRSLYSAFHSVLTEIGPKGYVASWGHPFPSEAFDVVARAVTEAESG